MLDGTQIHVWTCAQCKKNSSTNVWKWELHINPNDWEQREKLKAAEQFITRHVLFKKHEVIHRINEKYKVGRSFNDRL